MTHCIAGCHGDPENMKKKMGKEMTRMRYPPATELKKFDLDPIEVDECESEDGNNADAEVHEQEHATQANDGSTGNVED